MKIASPNLKSLIPKTEPLQSHSKKESSFRLKSPKDKVDLSAGLSLEKINHLLSTKIGQKIDQAFKKAGVDIRDGAGLDWSPEATAQRIFEGATGFLGVWRQQNPDLSEEELIDSFEKTVRGAVNKGYSQAMTALAPLNLGEGAKSTAEETISLVHEKFDGFFASLREGVEEEG